MSRLSRDNENMSWRVQHRHKDDCRTTDHNNVNVYNCGSIATRLNTRLGKQIITFILKFHKI